MKKFATIIAMLMYLCLCACSNVESPATSSNDPDPPEHIDPFCYDSLSDFKKSISKEEELYAELSKEGAKSETIEAFKAFVEKYQSQNIIVPHLNGKEIELRNKVGFSNIAVFPSECYGLPWVFFHPNVSTGENFYIKMAYLPDNLIAKQKNPIASEVIKELAPNSPNINNLGDQHESIYNQKIKLGDREVTALVMEYKTDNRNSTIFVYNDLLVEVRNNPKVWSSQWFSTLSFAGFSE